MYQIRLKQHDIPRLTSKARKARKHPKARIIPRVPSSGTSHLEATKKSTENATTIAGESKYHIRSAGVAGAPPSAVQYPVAKASTASRWPAKAPIRHRIHANRTNHRRFGPISRGRLWNWRSNSFIPSKPIARFIW